MNKQIFVISLLSATLAACGGDTGSSGTTAPAAALLKIDSSNEKQVASVGAGAASAVTSRSLSGGWSSVAGNLVAKIQQLAPSLSKRSGFRAAQTFDQLCQLSGSRSISLNDVNNNGRPDVGETATITLNQCNDGDGSISNGSMSATVKSCTASFVGGDCTASDITLDITVSDVNGTGSGRVQGDMSNVSEEDANFMMGKDHTTSSKLSFSFGNESVTFYDLISDSSWDDNTGIYSDASDFTLDLNVTGFVGRLVVDNTQPMVSNNSSFYPDTGSTAITGLSGTTVVLDANTGNQNTVTLTTTINGSVTSQEVTWLELEQQSPIPSFF